jgi:hypothetical protein
MRGWVWVFTAVALLMNPFVPIRMHRTDWQPVDLFLVVLLFCWSALSSYRGTCMINFARIVSKSQDKSFIELRESRG